MSSTNKTTKLGLSQFLGTDKPAWLGDYNSDMQKIDDAFANLEQDGQSSAAGIAALQQKDIDLTQDISDVNDRVDEVVDGSVKIDNRVTTLEGNYDTIHHEMVLTQEDVNEIKEDVNEIKEHISGHAASITVTFDQPDVPNKSVAEYTCVKEIELPNGYYLAIATFNTPKNTDAGKVIGFGISKTGNDFGSGRFMYVRDVTKSEGQTFLSVIGFVNVTAGKIWYNVENGTSDVLEVYGGVSYLRLY